MGHGRILRGYDLTKGSLVVSLDPLVVTTNLRSVASNQAWCSLTIR
jgi:hypothetical protein